VNLPLEFKCGLDRLFDGHVSSSACARVVGQPQKTAQYHTLALLFQVCTVAQHITSIDYDLQGAADFQSYAHDKLLAGLDQYIAALITAPPYSIAADQAQQISPWMAEGLVAHYAGDEVMPSDMQANIQSLSTATDYPTKLAGILLRSVWTDLPPPDNNVVLDLATR
jgi:hypothetical protein